MDLTGFVGTKAPGRSASAVEDGQSRLSIEIRGQKPGHLGTLAAQTGRTEHLIQHQRLVYERPRVRMLPVLTPELRQKLSGLYLKIPGQRCRLPPRLLQFDARFPVGVQFIDEGAKALEVRVYRAVERQFHVGNREAANERIVIALEERPYVWSSRPAEIRESIEAR